MRTGRIWLTRRAITLGFVIATLAACATLVPGRAPLTWKVEGLTRQDGPNTGDVRWTYTLVIGNPGRLPATLLQESVVLAWDGVYLSPEIERTKRLVALGAPLRMPCTSVFRRSDFEAGGAQVGPGRPSNAPHRTEGMAIAWQFVGNYEGGGGIILNIDVLPERAR